MINLSQDQIHAQKLWEHLDSLAENNPEEYKKFIQSQMKNGIDMMKSTKNNSNESLSQDKEVNLDSLNFTKEEQLLNKLFEGKGIKNNLKSYAFMCLRFKIKKFMESKPKDKVKSTNSILIQSSNDNTLSSKDIIEAPKILFSTKFVSESLTSKIIQEPKIYLNIVYSDDFFEPLNSLNKPESDINKWNYIPTIFRPAGIKKSMRNIECQFYDCIVNTSVQRNMSKDEKLKSQVLSYLSRKFNIFMSHYCELYLTNVKIVENHTYKGITSLPQLWSLQKEKVEKVENKQIPEIQLLDKKIIENNKMEMRFSFNSFENISMDLIDLQVNNCELKILVDSMPITEYKPIYFSFNDFIIDEDSIEAKFNQKEKVLKIVISKK